MTKLFSSASNPHVKCVLTHFVTEEIFTPNTPMGFREGILFRLNSRLVNFTDIFTSIFRKRCIFSNYREGWLDYSRGADVDTLTPFMGITVLCQSLPWSI